MVCIIDRNQTKKWHTKRDRTHNDECSAKGRAVLSGNSQKKADSGIRYQCSYTRDVSMGQSDRKGQRCDSWQTGRICSCRSLRDDKAYVAALSMKPAYMRIEMSAGRSLLHLQTVFKHPQIAVMGENRLVLIRCRQI